MGTRDLEIARAVKLRPVEQVAETLGLDPDDLEPYGAYKAKVRWKAIERSRVRPDGALVLVTAMTPTPAGEGKSTIARSEEHTSELQSQSNIVCRLLLEKKKHSNRR